MKVQKNSLFQKVVLNVTGRLCYFLFQSVEHYFPSKKEISLPHPSIVVCNHVDHLDVPLLTSFDKYTAPNIRYTVPVRADLVEKNFLVNEYRPRGFIRLALKFLDFTKIIPFLLQTVGAVPVNRPFRGNSKRLAKEGKFREEVEKDWQVLARNINMGRNLFLFPEGTISPNGALTQIKSGIYFILQKITNPNFYCISLTYDYLFDKKPMVHANHVGKVKISNANSKESIAQELSDSIRSGIMLTPGNLFSFLLYTEEVKQGIETEVLWNRFQKLLSILSKSQFHLVSNLPSLPKEWFQQQLDKCSQNGFINLSNGYLKSKESLYREPAGRARKYRKTNPYLYHYNQIIHWKEKLEEYWKS